MSGTLGFCFEVCSWKESWGLLVFVFEVIWKNFESPLGFFWSIYVIWKDLGDSLWVLFLEQFEGILGSPSCRSCFWSNLKEYRGLLVSGLWRSFEDFRASLFWFWSNFKEFRVLVFCWCWSSFKHPRGSLVLFLT